MRFRGFNSQFGQRRPSFGPGLIPPFIKVMLITNVVIFIIQLIYPQLTYALGLSPKKFFSDFPNLIYQPFTYMFLHGGIGHIFFNMFMLWMFGTEIERNLGTKRFARFYIFSGLAGAILTMIVKSGQIAPMIGASAAVYGVLAAYWVMFPNRLVYIYFLFPVKVKWMVPGMMLLGFLFGGANVAHWAHLGGALYGLAYLKLDWRLDRTFGRIRNLRRQMNERKIEKEREEYDITMQKVDEILDKINEVGIENLSPAEREFLDKASSHLAKKKK